MPEDPYQIYCRRSLLNISQEECDLLKGSKSSLVILIGKGALFKSCTYYRQQHEQDKNTGDYSTICDLSLIGMHLPHSYTHLYS